MKNQARNEIFRQMAMTLTQNVIYVQWTRKGQATRRYKRHQNKVKVKGLGRNSSYLAGFSIFFTVL